MLLGLTPMKRVQSLHVYGLYRVDGTELFAIYKEYQLKISP